MVGVPIKIDDHYPRAHGYRSIDKYHPQGPKQSIEFFLSENAKQQLNQGFDLTTSN